MGPGGKDMDIFGATTQSPWKGASWLTWQTAQEWVSLGSFPLAKMIQYSGPYI